MKLEGGQQIRIVFGKTRRSSALKQERLEKSPVLQGVAVSRPVKDSIKAHPVRFSRGELCQPPRFSHLEGAEIDIVDAKPKRLAS